VNLWLLLAGWVGLSVPTALCAGLVLGGGNRRAANRPATVLRQRSVRHPLHG